jgi:iron complex transport system substrate-binding protein
MLIVPRASTALVAGAVAVASLFAGAPAGAQPAPRVGQNCSRVGASGAAADGTRLLCVRTNTGVRRWTAATLRTVAPPATAGTPAIAPATTNPTDCAGPNASGDLFPQKAAVDEASAFTIRYAGTYKVVTVTNPWRGATARPTYVLVQCGTKAPALEGDLRGATVIEIPVKRISLMGTAQAAMAGALGVTGSVVALDEPDNYSTPGIVSRVKEGAVRRSGYSGSANLEVLLSAKPDMVWANGFGSAADGLDKMRSAGLPVVVFADNMEKTPLGRAEWVKFLAAFTNTEAVANREWAAWAASYRSLASRVARTTARPGAISGSMFQGTWFMPGGQSFPAQLIRDAGASYAWSTDQSTGSMALDFETVFDRAYDAQYWVNAGFSWSTLRDARAEDSRYARLLPFSAGNAFANDARTNATGGNDYFETATIRPDLVLADLVSIFHPEVLPEHQLLFYRRLPRS